MNSNSEELKRVSNETLTSAERYEDLVKALEKSIDDLGQGNSKEGWTSFALLSAIAASIVGFLGYSAKIHYTSDIVAKISLIAASGVLLGYFLRSIMNSSIGRSLFRPKRKRFMETKRLYRELALQGFVRLISLLAVALILFYYLPDHNLALVAAAIIVLGIFPLGFVILKTLFDRGMSANHPFFEKSQKVQTLGSLFLYGLLLAISCSSHIKPFGELGSAIYGVGLSAAAIVILFELLLSYLPNPTLIQNLRDLRDDMLFQRVSFEEAITQYRLLKEGYTLSELIAPEANIIIRAFDQSEEALRQQGQLLQQMEGLIKLDESGKSTLGQIIDLMDEYLKHFDPIIDAIAVASDKLDVLDAILKSGEKKSGDYDARLRVLNEFREKLSIHTLKREENRERLQIVKEFVTKIEVGLKTSSPDQSPS